MSHNPEATKVEEYAAFDVLRFVLASAVMLSHIGVLRWGQTGNLAVQVFFALSGWLIGGILYRTSAVELSRFYFNRATRIWIPYFVCVAILYGVSLWHEPRGPRWGEFLTYDLTFTHNWFALSPNAQTALQQMPLQGTGNHFWSLAVEEQFYLAAPLIITLLPFGRAILPWVLLAIAAYLTHSQYAAIAVGVLAAVIAGHSPRWHLKRTLPIAALAVAAALSLPFFYGWGAPFFAVSVVLLCARPLERNAVTRWVGGISFPFYLNAWIGIFVFHALEKHGLAGYWPLEYMIGIAGAAVLYHLVDVPVMAYRNGYYRPALGWAMGITGYVLVLTGLAYWLS